MNYKLKLEQFTQIGQFTYKMCINVRKRWEKLP